MFYIDNEKAQITSRKGWVVSPTKIPLRLGLFVENEETVFIPDVKVDAGARLHLTFGFENFEPASRARIRVKWTDGSPEKMTAKGKSAAMKTINEITSDQDNGTWIERSLPIDDIQGRVGTLLIEFEATEDAPALMLYELVLAKPEELSLARARSFNKVRSENEIAHYKHMLE